MTGNLGLVQDFKRYLINAMLQARASADASAQIRALSSRP
jgi:hypothetical protein